MIGQQTCLVKLAGGACQIGGQGAAGSARLSGVGERRMASSELRLAGKGSILEGGPGRILGRILQRILQGILQGTNQGGIQGVV